MKVTNSFAVWLGIELSIWPSFQLHAGWFLVVKKGPHLTECCGQAYLSTDKKKNILSSLSRNRGLDSSI